MVNKKRILHIAPDEKFINSAVWQFENLNPQNNLFIILLEKNQKEYTYVKPNKQVISLIKNKDGFKRILRIYNDYDLICFHNLDVFACRLIMSFSLKKKILWILFGQEIYNNEFIIKKKEIFGKYTYKYHLKKNGYKFFFRKIKNILLKKKLPYSIIKETIKSRINYCGCPYKEEIDFINERINDKIEHIKFCYYPIEFIFKKDSEVTGENILIGNSSIITNNHLDAFMYLKKVELGKRKLITPLSYGDMEYQKFIVKKGYKYFPNNFEPLVDFLNLEDYNRYISQCSIAIMANIRQQAIGNVIAMLWMGAKVFLNKKNTLYKYLIRLGIHVFCVERDLVGNKDALIPLSSQIIKKNRELLLSEFGQKNLNETLKEHLENLLL